MKRWRWRCHQMRMRIMASARLSHQGLRRMCTSSHFDSSVGIGRWDVMFPGEKFELDTDTGNCVEGSISHIIPEKLTGWWLTYPSEKWWSERQLGWWNSQLFMESHSKFHGSSHQPDWSSQIIPEMFLSQSAPCYWRSWYQQRWPRILGVVCKTRFVPFVPSSPTG